MAHSELWEEYFGQLAPVVVVVVGETPRRMRGERESLLVLRWALLFSFIYFLSRESEHRAQAGSEMNDTLASNLAKIVRRAGNDPFVGNNFDATLASERPPIDAVFAAYGVGLRTILQTTLEHTRAASFSLDRAANATRRNV